MKKSIVLFSIMVFASATAMASDTSVQDNMSAQSVALTNVQVGVANTNAISISQSSSQSNMAIDYDHGHYGYYGYHHDYDASSLSNSEAQSLSGGNLQSGLGNLSAIGATQANAQSNTSINE